MKNVTRRTLLLSISVFFVFLLGIGILIIVCPVAQSTPPSSQTEQNPLFSLLGNTEDSNHYVRQKMSLCYSKGGQDQCYERIAALFSAQFSLKETLTLLKNNESFPEVYSRCHEVTHYVARNEFQRVKSIPAVYESCNSTCHGGCYHGAVEEFLKEKQAENIPLGEQILHTCGQLSDYQEPRVFFECLHGIGHAVMFVTNMDLPRSLQLCDHLDTQQHRITCYGGVFMENSSSSTNNDHPGKYIKTSDPLYPCDTLAGPYVKTCYSYQSSYFAILGNYDWPKVAAYCLKVPTAYQEECFRTIGTNQVGFTEDMTKMKTDCEGMPAARFVDVCLQGVVDSLGGRFVGEPKRMGRFCSMIALQYQHNCFREMGQIMRQWSRDDKQLQIYCEQLSTPDSVRWCKDAAAQSTLEESSPKVFQ